MTAFQKKYAKKNPTAVRMAPPAASSIPAPIGKFGELTWKTVCDHIEGITMSYHSPGPEKLKKFFKTTVLAANNKRVKEII